MMLLTLLGEQPIPNLLPLWQFPEFDSVCFAATERTKGLAENLMKFISSDPTLQQVSVLPPLILPAYDLPEARSLIAAALSEAAAPPGNLVINLTGGTKLMSLAAMQAAYGQGVPLMYVSSEQNLILWYSSDGVEIKRQEIRVRISVEQYLLAHGIEVSDRQNFHPSEKSEANPPPKSGDWLEEAVFNAVHQSGFFDDVRRNLFIRRPGRRDKVLNELDVLVTRNGRLAVCSCKSGKVTPSDLYELEALSNPKQFGIYCGRVFVSARPKLGKGFRERAAASRIDLVFGEQTAERAVNAMQRAVSNA